MPCLAAILALAAETGTRIVKAVSNDGGEGQNEGGRKREKGRGRVREREGGERGGREREKAEGGGGERPLCG